MNQGPLNEEELEWLDEVLLKHGNEDSVLDVSELDGLLTAVLSGPTVIEPAQWLTALWGGEEHVPHWSSEQEMTRFMDLTFQHMNDIDQRLNEAPDQFDPMFGYLEEGEEEHTIVEEWCFGYLRGMALGDWPPLPADLEPALGAITLHGQEENAPLLAQMTPEEYAESQEAIQPAALQLHAYWREQRAPQLH
jgi:uncharacterized protein